MKKFFWFAVAILLLITFSGEEPLKKYRDLIYDKTIYFVTESWQTDDRGVGSVRREFAELSATLGKGQQDMLSKAATDRQSILQFRQRYCVDQEFSRVLFGEPQKKSCDIIQKYLHLLLED